jgi:sarcosine oxidase
MANNRYDVIVVGVGGMGSATAYHLARRGHKVLGLERFDIPHEMGSSHGITRIIRLAYYEDPSYVPLLRRAYELWHELEQTANEKLLHKTGSVDAGPEDSAVFQGSLNSCHIHDIPHEVLTSSELSRRFPGYQLPAKTMALLQADGGFLLSERCIVAHVEAAQAHGAEIHGREGLLDWEPFGDGVRVRTERGEYEADKLVLTAGAWMGKLSKTLSPLLEPERQVLLWLQPKRAELFTPERFPVFNLLVDEGRFYGFPVHGIPGMKLGMYHHLNENVDPDSLDRTQISKQDEQVLREFVEKYMPDAAGPTQSLKVCMFTNTPDEHFILDFHPKYPQVILGSPCSGHGFKFSSVVGEILADLAIDGQTRHNIDLLRLNRLQNT